MSFKTILCFLVIFAVAQKILGDHLNKKRYGQNPNHRRYGNIKVKAAIPHPAKLQVHIEGICHSYEGKKCAPEDEGKLIGVKTLYILQEYYNKNCTSGDLAILELSEVIGDHGATISDSIELPTSGDFVVSGFGEDPENDVDTGHTLKTVTLTAQKCDENHGNYDSVCTVEIDKDGDSGGALVDKNNVIVGIVSSGRDCAVLYESVENNKSENSPLKQWEGGIFTSTSLHYGFICDIVGIIKLKGCPNTFNKEPYLTIS
uniref:Peptidase S1 domain-containing protein n=1 Tax=Panagrolaimus davidi TaxID=227884 RepID=A0A914P5C1_9BILA